MAGLHSATLTSFLKEFRVFVLFSCLVVVEATAIAAEEKKAADEVKLITVAFSQNVFGGQEIEFRFRLESARALKGRISWRYSIGTATVGAREVETAAGPDVSPTFSIKLAIPPVKDGVILQSRLTLTVFEVGQKAPAATFDRDVWIFPRDPFVDRADWLKQLKITLYDPARTTSKLLTAAKIPFEEIGNSAQLPDHKEGLLLIGEGIAFKEERDLTDALAKLVGNGVVVFCLAPATGQTTIPGLGGAANASTDLTFCRDIMKRLDKRLDAENWLPDGKVITSSAVMKMVEDAAVVEFSPSAVGWTWIEGRSVKGKGRIGICGHAIMAKWETSPTPRYLFARLLEHLSDLELKKN
ncbi:MAG: hypothetical protein K8T89_15455 [Planctomycetes bacterium]|nr:hypothetical protein [Planctomycetota bacterium]